MKEISTLSRHYMGLTHRYEANHYDRLPVVEDLSRDCRIWDVDGNVYLDMFAGYSVVNFGHCHPTLTKAVKEQVDVGDHCSGAVYSRMRARFTEVLAEFSGLPDAKVLLMNTGAEAVEKAMKIARRWGYERKGVRYNQAEIITPFSNFHGRTFGVLSIMAVEESIRDDHYHRGFGPFLPGFCWIPFGSAEALEEAITENTVAFLAEPIQGEGGFVFPSKDYWKEVVSICRRCNILLILDEIPTALGRTGCNFPHEHDGITPDIVVLGKALGGGLVPVSAVVARAQVMDVLDQGSDGSTFGGYPLACAVGLAVIKLMKSFDWGRYAKTVGDILIDKLKQLKHPLIKEVRGRGLFVGVELQAEAEARQVCLRLLEKRVLTVSARRNVVRFTPPLIITEKEIEKAVNALGRALENKN